MISVILADRQLWKKMDGGSEGSGIWIEFIQSATKFILIALAVFLVSGLGLLYSNNWVHVNQPWFILKSACFILFTVNGALVGGNTVTFVDKQLREKNYNMDVLTKAKTRMGRFHIIQLILVAAIIFLGTFKPSFG